MANEQVLFTVTFDKVEEQRFKEILTGFDPDNFSIIKDASPMVGDARHNGKLQATLSMTMSHAFSLRFGMNTCITVKVLSPEEQAIQDAEDAKNRITVNVKVYEE